MNIIDISSGRQIRAAELGYFAERPSFCDGGIKFFHNCEAYQLSLDTGEIIKLNETNSSPQHNSSSNVRLEFLSEPIDGIAYVALVLKQIDGSSRILGRFMGSESSLGENPVSSDGNKVVFFGYPM
ncbi:MAG: hypothetical protein HFE63_07320 [Clostridiales bacterium]|nr:hypothetical protein [Clostridiales bacterium]